MNHGRSGDDPSRHRAGRPSAGRSSAGGRRGPRAGRGPPTVAPASAARRAGGRRVAGRTSGDHRRCGCRAGGRPWAGRCGPDQSTAAALADRRPVGGRCTGDARAEPIDPDTGGPGTGGEILHAHDPVRPGDPDRRTAGDRRTGPDQPGHPATPGHRPSVARRAGCPNGDPDPAADPHPACGHRTTAHPGPPGHRPAGDTDRSADHGHDRPAGTAHAQDGRRTTAADHRRRQAGTTGAVRDRPRSDGPAIAVHSADHDPRRTAGRRTPVAAHGRHGPRGTPDDHPDPSGHHDQDDRPDSRADHRDPRDTHGRRRAAPTAGPGRHRDRRAGRSRSDCSTAPWSDAVHGTPAGAPAIGRPGRAAANARTSGRRAHRTDQPHGRPERNANDQLAPGGRARTRRRSWTTRRRRSDTERSSHEGDLENIGDMRCRIRQSQRKKFRVRKRGGTLRNSQGTSPSGKYVRRCPTLPHPGGCSTIGAMRLSFRVRNGTGRFPHAITAETL